jgi:hypothetical protein
MHLDGDAVAERELVDRGPELDHRAHVFMARGEPLVERQLALDQRRQPVLQNLDVGGADRDRVDPQQHLGRTRLGHRLLGERQLVGIAEHPCLHRRRDRVLVGAGGHRNAPQIIDRARHRPGPGR